MDAMLFLNYIKGKKKIIGVFFVFAVIFAVVFWQYRLPLAAVAYPSLLCAFFGTIFLLLDFWREAKKAKELERLCGLTAAMITELPKSEGLMEHGYQKLVCALLSEVKVSEASSEEKYRNMVDYYTLWAHQIKTPIASMRLQLQNEDTDASRRLRADLFRVEQYAEMVLAYLRLDFASTDYVFKEYSLDAVLRQAVKKFSHEFIGRKIRLDYTPTEKTLVTDEKWLSFVVEQLLSNALKYTKEGSIRIFMETPRVLCISDTGIGIAPEDLPRIFENGYTGYNGRSDKRASGIGLYLCKRICDNLGIGIFAASEVGTGTVMRLEFT